MKEYSKGIYVKFKPEEVEILHDRMKEAGVQNMSAYIRKMAINGYVIIPEWPDLNRVISLHARISNNLNQYANPDCHDRLIILDYGEKTELVYHCGASSKDAGKKLCAINQITETAIIHPVIDRLLTLPDKQI